MKAEQFKVGEVYIDDLGEEVMLVSIENGYYMFWKRKTCIYEHDAGYIKSLMPYTKPKPPVVIEGWVNAYREDLGLVMRSSKDSADLARGKDCIDNFGIRYTLENGKRKLEVIE